MQQLNPGSALSEQLLMNQFDAFADALRNMALSSAGLAIGTTTSQVKIANTVTYLNGGVFKSKTTADTAFTATTHDIPANASTVQEAVYLVSLDAAGAVTITMGAIATGSGNAQIPERVAGKTPVGHVRIAVAAGATPFDATTDALSAGHLTVTYTNVGFINNRFDSAQ